MKKQFVTYEIALALKELGFDEEVIATYDTEEIGSDKELKIFAFSVPNKGVFEEGFKRGWCIKAPLWQQAIDWLREKHNINIAIDYLLLTEKWIAEIYYINDEMKGESTPALKTYDETREKAIERAIEEI